MTQPQSDVFTAKDLLGLLGILLWFGLSCAFLATSICLTVLIHHHTAWPAGIFVSGLSLFFFCFIGLLKIADD